MFKYLAFSFLFVLQLMASAVWAQTQQQAQGPGKWTSVLCTSLAL